MKILLVNKFYYARGGDCIYTIELEKLLRENGHDVAIYSMQYEKNYQSKYQSYWPSELNYSSGKKENLKETLLRPVYSSEVIKSFTHLMKDFRPDIVHLNNIHTQISPVVAQISHKFNVPVVWTLHDYKLFCPAYVCYTDNKPCDACLRSKMQVIKNKCIKGSLTGSVLGYLEIMKWNIKKLQRYTDMFICPSSFMKSKMLQAGVAENKLRVLNNFIADEKIENEVPEKKDYYCYFGRLSAEKGIETLLRAAVNLPDHKLKIIGTGPMQDKLISSYKTENIEFLGFKQWDQLSQIVKGAQFSVVPSEWYENNPLSIIESFSLGTPVIGADIGGISELIDDKVTGLLFESKNEKDLTGKIDYFYKNLKGKDIGFNAIRSAKERYSSSNYYNSISDLYKQAIDKNSRK